MGLEGFALSSSPKRGSGHATSCEDREPKRARGASANTEEQLATVIAALDHADHLSDTGKELLRCMAAGCLSTPPEMRHELQVAVAQMLRQAFDGIADGLLGKLREASEGLRELEDERSLRQKELQSGQASLDGCAERILQAKSKFSEDNVALESSRARLDDARLVREQTDGKWMGAKQLKIDVERTIEDHYKPVLAGGDGDMKPHLDAIQSLFGHVPIEDSLSQAFSAAAKLKPPARGNFDRWAMEQLLKELQKHVTELDALAQSSPVGLGERARAVAEAEAGVQRAREQQRSSAASLRLTELEAWEGEGAADAADEAVLDAEEAVGTAVERRAGEEAALGAFRDGPCATLAALAGCPQELPKATPAAAVQEKIVVSKGAPTKDVVMTPTKAKDGLTQTSVAETMAGVPTPLRSSP